MIIKNCALYNFRNYEKQEIEFHRGTNLFYGENAQGKTNILEAVYLCGTTKSHRGSKDREMIRFGSEEAHIQMNAEKNDIPFRVDMHLKKNASKGIAVNRVPIKKASELLGMTKFVFFSPEDLNIIKNGPSGRRRFMDMELSQLNALYLHHLTMYNRTLMQRNKLLKDMGFHTDYAGTLDLWDEQLLRYGSALITMREEFISMMNTIIRDIHLKLSGGREELMLVYEKNTDVEGFKRKLLENREKDLRYKMTHAGPHRDDISFLVKYIDIRRFGSQGQQRTVALSLKLAEIELVKKVSRDVPVLLLDDVLSELDSGRQKFLLGSIRDIQTLITATGTDFFEDKEFQIDRLFFVKDGQCREEKNG